MNIVDFQIAREEISRSDVPEEIKAIGLDIIAKIEASKTAAENPTMGQGGFSGHQIQYALMNIVEAAIMGKKEVRVGGARDTVCTKILAEITS